MRSPSRLLCLVALCVLAGGALAGAASTPPTIPIAGVAGGGVQAVATLRTADGGAILLARVTASARSADGHVIVARLQASGALDLGYGDAGLVTLPVDARALPTALAVAPARGDAWVGVDVGRGLPGQIVALDTHGRLVGAFGKGGVLGLPAGDAGGPVALDWSADKVLLAAGTDPCRGCRLSVIGAISGRVITSSTLSAAGLGSSGCGASISSAVFTGDGREAVATDTRARGCASELLALGANLQPQSGTAPMRVAGASASLAVSGGGTSWGCFGTAGAGGVRISSYAGTSVSKQARAPSGTLLALAPIAQGACGALIGAQGGGVVAQAASGDGSAVTDRVPSAVAAGAMFRCHQHLLAVGVEGASGHRAAVVVAVPVRRGGASAAVVGTGCH